MAAYEELVRRYQDIALRTAYLITGGGAEAEDATQEALVKAYHALGRFKPGAPFRPWLLRIVANEARNRRVAEGRRAALALHVAAAPAQPGPPTPEALALRGERHEALLRALAALRPQDRLIIAYRYFLDLSEEEMATALGCPAAVRSSRVSPAPSCDCAAAWPTRAAPGMNKCGQVWPMAERRPPQRPTDAQLARALSDLHEDLEYPQAPGMAVSVSARLRAEPDGPDTAARSPWLRRALAALLIASGLIAGALALSPDARATVLCWLAVRGVLITAVPSLPPTPAAGPPPTRGQGLPAVQPLRLGRRTTLAGLRGRLTFGVLAPTLPGLGQPTVYLDPQVAHGQVALVYLPNTWLPRASAGVGLLLTEFQATLMDAYMYKKYIPPETQVRFLTIDGASAVWLTGAPHAFAYAGPTGDWRFEELRLAGNTLLWQRGPLTLRLESALDLPTALRVAASLRSTRP